MTKNNIQKSNGNQKSNAYKDIQRIMRKEPKQNTTENQQTTMEERRSMKNKGVENYKNNKNSNKKYLIKWQ